MAAIRALVAIQYIDGSVSPLQVSVDGEIATITLAVTYALIDSANNVIEGANGQFYTQLVIGPEVWSYSAVNNPRQVITSAVQANESDPSLQVFIA